MSKFSRRLFIKEKGLIFTLPLLSNLIPFSAEAAPGMRKNFIGIFFPNGSIYNNEIGQWNWNKSNGVLNALTEGPNSIKANTMIIRKMFSPKGVDPHWQNTTSMMSGNIIGRKQTKPRCGKTIDQYIADKQNGAFPHRSLVIGDPFFQKHPAHPELPQAYLNRISWLNDETMINPQVDPVIMFNNFFAASKQSANQIAYLHENKKSILDLVFKDLKSITSKTSSDGKIAMQQYESGLRDVERSLATSSKISCSGADKPKGNYKDYKTNPTTYSRRIRDFNKMIVFAFKCKLTNVASMMYAPSVSGTYSYGVDSHHKLAHAGDPKLAIINKIHLNLLKDLVVQLKNENLINDTLVYYSSDMSHKAHGPENIPTLLCGGGSDLKFGQDINFSGKQPRTKLLLSILSMYGINRATLGEGAYMGKGNLNSSIQS